MIHTLRQLSGVLLALVVIAQSGWILLARPDPPPTAVTATRRSRTIIAACALVYGIAYLIFLLVS